MAQCRVSLEYNMAYCLYIKPYPANVENMVSS